MRQDEDDFAGKDMLIVDVADLPWAHAPFRCRFWREFDSTVPAGIGEGERSQRFGRFARGVPRNRLPDCPYHRPDWLLAAEGAVQAWKRGTPGALGEESERAHAMGATDATVHAMWSFVFEPIFLNGVLLGNGQHRVCAMKLAGVRRCLIER